MTENNILSKLLLDHLDDSVSVCIFTAPNLELIIPECKFLLKFSKRSRYVGRLEVLNAHTYRDYLERLNITTVPSAVVYDSRRKLRQIITNDLPLIEAIFVSKITKLSKGPVAKRGLAGKGDEDEDLDSVPRDDECGSDGEPLDLDLDFKTLNGDPVGGVNEGFVIGADQKITFTEGDDDEKLTAKELEAAMADYKKDFSNYKAVK